MQTILAVVELLKLALSILDALSKRGVNALQFLKDSNATFSAVQAAKTPEEKSDAASRVHSLIAGL